MDVQVQHFLERELGEIGVAIDEQIAPGFQLAFAVVEGVIVNPVPHARKVPVARYPAGLPGF